MRKCLAVIPARGGSKGIKKKNIQIVAGMPLIAYTIRAVKNSRPVDRIIVSTDDSEIASVAQKYGAEVMRRPAEISGDSASSESALLNVLQQLHEKENYRPDILIFLQCTSPLTSSADIEQAISILDTEGADSVLSVTPFHYFLWKTDPKGDAVGINHDKHYRPMRQQREMQYLETGALYVMRVTGFLQYEHRFFGKTAFHVMPSERVLEIDEPMDLEIAEARLRRQSHNIKETLLPESISALIMDFDGVFTDNQVLVNELGQEAVWCSRSDGMGIADLKKNGLPMLVITSEENNVVKARCKKLALTCAMGVSDKERVMKDWCAQNQVLLAGVVYLGNDKNDLACMRIAGCPVAPCDAHESVKSVARVILDHCGGRGAIRELCDMIVKQTSGFPGVCDVDRR